MGSKWPASRLDDLAELIVDCPHSTPKWRDEGEVVLRSQNIRNGRLDLTSTSYTDHDGYLSRVKRAVPQAEDLVFTREAPMGEVCMIPHGLKCCMGQRMVLIRTKRDLLSPHYLLYLIQSPFLQHQISWNEGTGTTVSNIRIPNIKAFEIPLPPLAEQKAIAHILGSLDDKIELNRRMNATLEGMAQALFKSWFVDFDPVLDNAILAGSPIPDEFAERAKVRRKLLEQNQNDECSVMNDELNESSTQNSSLRTHHSLFPATFQFTEELGWIPEGWEVLPMPGGTTFREGPGILAKDFHEDGVPLIRLAGLKSGVSLLDGCNYLDPDKVDSKWSQFRLAKGDILLSSSASLGRVAEVDDEAVGTIPYTGIIGFRPILTKTTQRYIRHYLTSLHFQNQVLMVGAGSVLNHFGPTHLKKMIMLVPSLRTQEAFSRVADSQDKAQYHRLQQSASLTKLRDTLLPKLISGELLLK